MAQHYFEDRVAGVVQVCTTETEALSCAEESLRHYRTDARRDGEWSMDIEDVTVGRIDPDAEDEDEARIPTHRATASGDEAGGFDYAMRPIEAVPVPGP